MSDLQRFSSYDGTELGYRRLGDGRLLVCLPGGPGRAVAYLEDLGGLSAHRTLLLLDPRATGHSEVPPDPSTMRFDRLALDLEALREHLGRETLDLLAHSAGCLVAQAWASRFPDRVGSLVLVTPSARFQEGGYDDVPAIREAFRDEPWYADAAEAALALADAPRSQRASLERATRPFWYAQWDDRAKEHARGAETQSSKRALLGFSADAHEVDIPALAAGLAEVTAPVTVVGGDRDGLTGVDSVHQVASSFPNAVAVVVEGAGHYPWVDQPERFVDAVLSDRRTL